MDRVSQPVCPEVEVVGDVSDDLFRLQVGPVELQVVSSLPDVPEEGSDNRRADPRVAVRQLRHVPEVAEGAEVWGASPTHKAP